MKIAIFGGSGFIGSYLVDSLLLQGHEIRIFDRDIEKFRKPNSEVKYFIGDFGDNRIVNSALSGYDIAYHLISSTNPGSSNLDPIKDIQENLIHTIQFLQLCVRNKIKKVIFLSSGGAIYGNPKYVPIGEEHPLNPESSYGIHKLAVEKYLHFFYLNYGLDYTIVRPSNPYGPRQNPFAKQGLITVALQHLKQNDVLTIWGDGLIVRDYLFIDDLIDAIIRVTWAKSTNKIFNVGSGIGYSINDLIEIIEKVVGKNLAIEYMNSRSCDPTIAILDYKTINIETGWTPTTDIRIGIMKTWEYVKNC